MQVIFDPQIFALQKYGGISRYVASMATRMFELQGGGVEIYCPRYSSRYLKDVPPTVFAGGEDVSGQRLWPYTRLLYTAADLACFGMRLMCRPYDIAHHTYYWPLPGKLPVRARVTTIHDMIDEVISPSPIKARLKLRSVRQSDFVICVSEYTRQTLLGLYDIAPEKTAVVHLGRPEIAAELPPRDPEASPYILYVGERGRYKNFTGLIAAYAASPRLQRDFRILCFGGGPFTAQERDGFAEYGIAPERIGHASGNDAALHALYRDTSLFVYPSRYEGFGLPPLEAMTLGAPVACSNATSIPEVVGEAGEYFDPDRPDSIREAMEAVLYSDTRRNDLIRQGRERAGKFSWDACARQTLDIYKTIV